MIVFHILLQAVLPCSHRPGADTLSLFPTKEHWLLSPNLQDVFLSLLHVDLDITRSLQETAEAFLRVIDSHILAGCISTIRQGK